MKTPKWFVISYEQEQLEIAELDAWRNPFDIPEIDMEQIKFLLENPPKFCNEQDHCISYQMSKDKCRCTRTLFKHETHYELYLALVKERIEQGFGELISKPGKHLDKE